MIELVIPLGITTYVATMLIRTPERAVRALLKVKAMYDAYCPEEEDARAV